MPHLPTHSITSITQKLKSEGYEIAPSELAACIVPNDNKWHECTNMLAGKKNKCGIKSTCEKNRNEGYPDFWVVTLHDFLTDRNVSWNSSEEAKEEGKQQKKGTKTIAERWESILAHEKKQGDTYQRTHPYAAKKQLDISNNHNNMHVKVHQYGTCNNLCVPMYKRGEQGMVITGIQYIDKDGEKKFALGSDTRGSYLAYRTTNKDSTVVYVCEGWADGRHIYDATGDTTVIAFSVHNLLNVAKIIKESSPTKKIVIVADNDEGKNTNNIGKKKSLEASAVVDGYVAIPPTPGDVSDMFLDAEKEGEGKGKEAVRAFLKEHTRPPSEEEKKKIQEEAKQNETIPKGYYLDKEEGLYYTSKKNEYFKVCSPITVDAFTVNTEGTNWGRVVSVKDSSGKWNEVIISMAQLAGNDKEVHSQLAYYGLAVVGYQGKRCLNEYLLLCTPTKTITTSEKLGWIPNTNLFLTKNGCIGETNKDIRFSGSKYGKKSIETKGTAQEWNQTIGKLCTLSDTLMFSVMVSFCVPILHMIQKPNIALHFYGISSIGKSTAAKVAASVYGNPDTFVESWRTTSTALERTAQEHNDLPLILDEINEASPETVLDSIYMLVNGRGKGRGSLSGYNKPLTTWRTIVMSNGELQIQDIAAKVRQKYKSKISEYTGGIEVRMISIPADAGEGNGIFKKEINGLKIDGEKVIKLLLESIRECYGTVGKEWIERKSLNALIIRERMKELQSENSLRNDDRLSDIQFTVQSLRVFEFFECVFYACCIASEHKKICYDIEQMRTCTIALFLSWYTDRDQGKAGMVREKKELITRVRSTLAENQHIHFEGQGGEEPKREQWGHLGTDGDDTVYFVMRDVFERELKGALKKDHALQWLYEEGMLYVKKKDEGNHWENRNFRLRKRGNRLTYYGIIIKEGEKNDYTTI